MSRRVWILIILITSTFFFIKLFFPEPSIFFIPENVRGDFWYFGYPIKDFLGDALKSGRLPLWNRLVGTGYPQFAEGQIGTFNIFNLILFTIFPTWMALNISYILIFYICFLGAFIFFRKNNISNLSSFLASFSFAFCGFFIGHITHFNLIQVSSFLPWFLIASQNLWGKLTKKNIIVFIFVFSQMLFSGHLQMVFTSLIAFLILLLTTTDPPSMYNFIRRITFSVLILTIAVLLSSVQLIPTAELFMNSVRPFAISHEAVISGLYNFKGIIKLFFPYSLSFTKVNIHSLYLLEPMQLESLGYVGLIPLIFTLFFLIRKNTKKKIKINFINFFFFLGVISLILLLGKNTPFVFLNYLPPFSLFRAHSRFILLLDFSVCGLFGISFDNITARLAKKSVSVRNTFVLIVFVFVFFDVYKLGFQYNPTVPVKKALKPPESSAYIAKGSRIYLDTSHNFDYEKYALENKWNDTQAYLYFNNGLEQNLNVVFDISNIRSYQVFPTVREYYYELVLNNALMDAASTGYIISTTDFGNNEKLNLVGEVKPPESFLPSYYIYKNLNEVPRLRFVTNYEIQPFNSKRFGEGTGNTIAFTNSNYNFKNAVILESDIYKRLDNLSKYSINLIKETDTRILLKTETDKDAILVISDSFYPGWGSKINGVTAKIMPANVNQRAIFVPKGSNIIDIFYRPYSLYIGAFISMLTILLLRSVTNKLIKLSNDNC